MQAKLYLKEYQGWFYSVDGYEVGPFDSMSTAEIALQYELDEDFCTQQERTAHCVTVPIRKLEDFK